MQSSSARISCRASASACTTTWAAPRGCTHVTELLGSLAHRGGPDASRDCGAKTRALAKPFQLDRCHALETTTDTVRRYYPKWYRGAPHAAARGGGGVKIHEYQGKEIFRKYGMATPRGIPAFSVDEAVDGGTNRSAATSGSSRRRSTPAAAARAAASRSRASPDEVRELAGKILGMQLVTHQTGPRGQKVRRLLIEEGADITQGALRRHGRRSRDAARRA